MRTLVMKFGGTTVGTTTALTQLASIVLTERERWDRLLIVVSALDGVTDNLIEAAQLAQLAQRRGYRRIIANLRTRHLALVEHLLQPAERAALLTNIDSLLYDLLDSCQTLSDRPASAHADARDAIIGVGERLAARIVAALLRQNNLRSVAVDTTDLIITDHVFGHAAPNMSLTRQRIDAQITPMLLRGILPVLTGFIGATPTGKPTTMGRGSSDYTAAIIGVCTDAQEVWIWTDVAGLMSADPLDIHDARPINMLSYEEAAEMAFFGARIIHPYMIGLLQEQRIPLRIRNIYAPQENGTRVQHALGRERGPLQAVTFISAIGLTAPNSGSLAELTAIVDRVFFEQTSTRAEVMISSQSPNQSFACFVVPTTIGEEAAPILRMAIQDQIRQQPEYQSWSTSIVSIVTVVGAGLERSHAMTARILNALDGIRLLAASYSPARCGLSVVVEPQDAEETLKRIHQLIVEGG